MMGSEEEVFVELEALYLDFDELGMNWVNKMWGD